MSMLELHAMCTAHLQKSRKERRQPGKGQWKVVLSALAAIPL